MIPKIIHYCWFGGRKLPETAKACIRTWKKYCPDYEIIEWNEGSYDLGNAPLYVRQACQAKKWAFVTDYVRLQVVYEQGGIYLDTDVELIRNLDLLRADRAYFGFETDTLINTGHGFGAEKGAQVLQSLMDEYQGAVFFLPDGKVDNTPCPERNTAALQKFGLVQDGSEQMLDGGIHIYPRSCFCPKNFESGEICCTENTYSIHHFNSSWHTGWESYLWKKRRTYREKYGEDEGRRKMENWQKRHRVLDVLMTEGTRGVLAKAKKKLSAFRSKLPLFPQ